jgi:hypothetical protein
MTEQLLDIPDFTDITHDEPTPWEDGWYKGTIEERREFTDSNGNDRVFESSDEPAQSSDSRNIRLQTKIMRASDNRTLNTSVMVNYRPEDFSAETVNAVKEQRERMKGESEAQWGSLYRAFRTLQRVGALQRIAGVRGFQQNGSGLDLSPLYNKTAYFRLGEDKRNPKYKQVVDFRETAPTKAKVL